MSPPDGSEYASFYGHYVELATGASIMDQLESQIADFRSVLDNIDESEASILHAPYTWTIKQVVGHLIDAERVFAYRALRFASGDLQPVVGMDQNPWVENSDYETPTLAALAAELEHCRRANVLMFQRFRPDAWDFRGIADGNEMSVRALAYCLVGHIRHHLEIIKSRVA